MGVLPHILGLKVGVPVMIIHNVLHTHLINGKIYVVKGATRLLFLLSTNPRYVPSS